MVSSDLPRDSSDAHRAGRGDRSPGADDLEPGGETTLRFAQENRALDVAALDVRVRDRRGHLPAPLPDLPATLNRAAASGLGPRRARIEPCAWSDFAQPEGCVRIQGRSFATCSLMTLPSARPAALAWTVLMTWPICFLPTAPVS